MGPAAGMDVAASGASSGDGPVYSPVPENPPVSPGAPEVVSPRSVQGVAVQEPLLREEGGGATPALDSGQSSRRILCHIGGQGLVLGLVVSVACVMVSVGFMAAKSGPGRVSGEPEEARSLWSAPWMDSVSQGACDAASMALGHPLCVTTSTTTTTHTTTTMTTTSTTGTTTTLTTTTTSTKTSTYTTSTSTVTTTSTTLPPCYPRPSKTPGKKHVVKGVSYAPVPIRTNRRMLPDDDFMSPDTTALWSKSGRNDLAIIKALGANTIRLYGNDPALNHSQFLNEAMDQGLDVIAGISDYPYTQMKGNCLHTDFDCYKQIKAQYAQNLQKGFLLEDGSYHTALQTVILMNEPDLKFVGSSRGFKRALVSAFDAVLDAEKEAGVEGPAPNLTVTFSFGVCPQCEKFGYKPGLGQMLELQSAMRDPRSVDYSPRNDLWTNYKTRFVNSVNTANPSTDIPRLFLDTYDVLFQGTPVFIGEYHDPQVYEQPDLKGILALAEDESTLLTGISFFEFQVRYDKGGSEMAFGMFGLSESDEVTNFSVHYKNFTSRCLTPVKAEKRRRPPGSAGLYAEATSDVYVHEAVAEAFGGEGVSENQLCPKVGASKKAASGEEPAVKRGAEPEASRGPATAKQVPLTWVGCFADGGELPDLFAGSGHDSNSCAQSCESFGYVLLKNGGECTCSDRRPGAPFFKQVQHGMCGKVCEGEDGYAPSRYCGGPTAYAVYAVYSAAPPKAPAAARSTSAAEGTDEEEAAALKFLLARHPEMELGTAAANLRGAVGGIHTATS